MSWHLAKGAQRAISAARISIWFHPSRTSCGMLDPKTTTSIRAHKMAAMHIGQGSAVV
jgi:hypothetical protein